MQAYLIGMDVGGTKTEVCLIRLQDRTRFESREILARERIATHQDQGGLPSYLKAVNALCQKLLSEQNISMKEVSGIGIGLPGTIDHHQDQMLQGSQAMFQKVKLTETYRQALNYPSGKLIFENDANCFVLTEGLFGVGHDFLKSKGRNLKDSLLLGITLGTGVGGGALYHGELIRGRHGGAAEFGHISHGNTPNNCYCGKNGCAEMFLSGGAYAKLPIETYREHLATFLSNLCNSFDPDAIIFGGGVSSESIIYEGLDKLLQSKCFLHEHPPALLKNKNGDSAGVIGAAYLALGGNS